MILVSFRLPGRRGTTGGDRPGQVRPVVLGVAVPAGDAGRGVRLPHPPDRGGGRHLHQASEEERSAGRPEDRGESPVFSPPQS